MLAKRTLTATCLSPTDHVCHHYELLKIPKSILVRVCSAGAFTLMTDSTQTPNSIPRGYRECRSLDLRSGQPTTILPSIPRCKSNWA